MKQGATIRAYDPAALKEKVVAKPFRASFPAKTPMIFGPGSRRAHPHDRVGPVPNPRFRQTENRIAPADLLRFA